MKKKIRLRDMTEEQYKKWRDLNCCFHCAECPFDRVVCGMSDKNWALNKDIYSDKFLDQEAEIPDILAENEKDYLRHILSAYCLPSDFRIEKWHAGTADEEIRGVIKDDDGRIRIALFSFSTTAPMPFKGIGGNDSFTLGELGL